MLIPVVLAGGVGSRLWPASRKLLPKQLQKFDGKSTMLQSTLNRVSGLNELGTPIVICNDEHRFLVEAQLAETDYSNSRIVLESVARNTAPAVAAAAILASSPDDILLIMPADHYSVCSPVPLILATATSVAVRPRRLTPVPAQ